MKFDNERIFFYTIRPKAHGGMVVVSGLPAIKMGNNKNHTIKGLVVKLSLIMEEEIIDIFIPAPVAESYECIVNNEHIKKRPTNGLGGIIYPLPDNKKMYEEFLMETVSLFDKHGYDASRIIYVKRSRP